MASIALTTRRALLAAPAVFPVLAEAAHAAPASKYDWPSFIHTMELMHPNGRRVAMQAFAAGMRLEDLTSIMLFGLNAARERPDLPVLMFKAKGPKYVRTFGPQGEK